MSLLSRALVGLSLAILPGCVHQITRYQIMTPSVQYLSPEGLHQNPAFSQVVVSQGSPRMVYVGGQNAVTAAGEIVGKGDLAAQAAQVFDNLEVALNAAEATLGDVIQWRVYLVEGQDARAAHAVFQSRWGERTTPPPLVTVVFVSALAHPDFLLEVEATAAVVPKLPAHPAQEQPAP
jgi:enamine deaminase RidA (YjgF/YER057c/UK114 family)